MLLDLEFVIALRTFLDRGGNVLFVICGVTFVMWTLMLERLWYFRMVHPREVGQVLEHWQARLERRSWYAEQERRLLIDRKSVV